MKKPACAPWLISFIASLLLLPAMASAQWYRFLLPPADDFRAFRPYTVKDITYLYDKETIMTMGEWASPDAQATSARLIELKGLPKKQAIAMFRKVIKKRKWNEFILGQGDQYYGYPGDKSSGPKAPYVGESITLSFEYMRIVELRFMSPFEVYVLHTKQVGNGPVEYKKERSTHVSPGKR